MPKPFDLEAAKRGEPVQTRDGRKVRLLCFDRVGPHPLVGLVTFNAFEPYEDIYCWAGDGGFVAGSHKGASPGAFDLVMAPIKRSRVEWVNIYSTHSVGYPTTDQAKKQAMENRLACVERTLEWEE